MSPYNTTVLEDRFFKTVVRHQTPVPITAAMAGLLIVRYKVRGDNGSAPIPGKCPTDTRPGVDEHDRAREEMA